MSEGQGKCQYFMGMIFVLFIFGAMYVVMSNSREGLVSKGRAYDVVDETYGPEYIQHYNSIAFSQKKFDHENELIVKYLKRSRRFSRIRVLDVGCGTGLHTAYLNNEKYSTLGLDVSKHAVQHCVDTYGHTEWFKHGNANNPSLFRSGEFTHILCLNYTVYYMSDQRRFLRNCHSWLKPHDGVMFLHLIDEIERNYLDTNGWVRLDGGVKYRSTFDVDGSVLTLDEKIKTPHQVLANRHEMHTVGNTKYSVRQAERAGFTVAERHKIGVRGFKNHWIYVLKC